MSANLILSVAICIMIHAICKSQGGGGQEQGYVHEQFLVVN